MVSVELDVDAPPCFEGPEATHQGTVIAYYRAASLARHLRVWWAVQLVAVLFITQVEGWVCMEDA